LLALIPSKAENAGKEKGGFFLPISRDGKREEEPSSLFAVGSESILAEKKKKKKTFVLSYYEGSSPFILLFYGLRKRDNEPRQRERKGKKKNSERSFLCPHRGKVVCNFRRGIFIDNREKRGGKISLSTPR